MVRLYVFRVNEPIIASGIGYVEGKRVSRETFASFFSLVTVSGQFKLPNLSAIGNNCASSPKP